MRIRNYSLVILLSGMMLSDVNSHDIKEDSVPKEAGDVRPILIGQKLPDISLTKSDNSDFNLNSEVSKKPAVLIFYRGGWCPYCNTHLGKLKTIEPELIQMGFQILAISPDRPALLKTAKEKLASEILLLSDSNMNVSRAMGIAFQVDDATVKKYKNEYTIDLEADSGFTHHQLPVPSVFLVATDGTIHFSYVNPNYKVRVEPHVLLASAKAMIKSSKE